jgi:hypothetical protein
MSTAPASKPTLAIIGGTGDLGSGLAGAWSAAGYPIVLGSRSTQRAVAAAAALGGTARGESNRAAAAAADVVVLAIPFANHADVLADIKEVVRGKIVINTTVPLVPPSVFTVRLPPQGSAALISQEILGPDVRVVAAFHNVGAAKLAPHKKADCDVLVFGDDKEARQRVIELATVVAERALDCGALANSIAAEALTSVLIWIGRSYKVRAPGVRITGLDKVVA